MREQKVKSTIKNLYSKLYIVAVTSIFPYIIRTLLIKYIGIEYTGVSSLFSSVLQVLNMADLGFGTAVVFFLYGPVDKQDVNKVNAILKLYRKAYRIVGVIITAAGLCVMPFLPELIQGKSIPDGINIYIIYLIYLFNATFGYLTVGYKEVLFEATKDADIPSKIGGTTALIMYIIQIFTICIYKSFYMYAAALMVNPILLVLLTSCAAKKHFPQYYCKGDVDKDFLKGFWKRIYAMTFSKLRTVSRNSFDSIIISMFLGLTALAKYQNYYMVMMIPLVIVNILRNSITPSFGNSVAFESKESNYGVLNDFTLIQNGIVVVCMSCLCNLYQPFIRLWIGSQYMLPDYMIYLFAIYFYAMSLSENTVMLREVTGIWWEGRKGAVIEAASNLILNYVLVKYYGIAGVVVSTIITIVFINLPWETYIIFKYYFNMNPFKYVIKQLVLAAESIVIVAITYIIGKIVIVTDIGSLLLKITGSVLIPVILWVLIHIKDKAVIEVISIIKKMVKKR